MLGNPPGEVREEFALVNVEHHSTSDSFNFTVEISRPVNFVLEHLFLVSVTYFAHGSPQGHGQPLAKRWMFKVDANDLPTLANFNSISLDFFILACQNGRLTGSWQELKGDRRQEEAHQVGAIRLT